ncbi:MAG: nucleotidyltransferase family protein [Gammaproteobacteria bacterium]|nr:nucleotidyltransferase family protein [Gammaproteobacteria bacterium]
MKAFILAAGRGERLRPLTDTTPKPLLPFKGAPLIVHHIRRLAEAGFQEVVINVSYQADKIISALSSITQIKLTFSYEPTALESGGGIVQALPLLGDNPFLVLSADIYTDYPFQRLMQQPAIPYLAHLVLTAHPDFNADFCLEKGLIKNPVAGEKAYTYANIGCYHPQLFAPLKPGTFPLGKFLHSAAEAKQLSGECYQGIWENITSVKQYTSCA